MPDYRQHHYVPQWYQQRFMRQGQSKYHYLDMKPDVVTNEGHTFTRRDILHWGTRRCFCETDLYTTRWGRIENIDIEKHFFGDIDNVAKHAIEYWDKFQHPGVDRDAFNRLLAFMCLQKLRTPKGLSWLAKAARADKNTTLILVQRFQNLYAAVWTECVWQLADAHSSATKFIVSDHPVTIYNRGCFPLSDHCRDDNDPDVRLEASHTIFPLSLERALILTNLSWARNPFQSETNVRPNPSLMRPAMFNFMRVQTHRVLTDDEVVQINYIIKTRARRYVAAAERDWLFPERHLKNSNWRKLGGGYLLMPEPRALHMGGEIRIGYDDGRSEAFSEYGHRPWDEGFRDEKRFAREQRSLRRVQREFAEMFGPSWRGAPYEYGRAGPRESSEDLHKYHLQRVH